MSRSASNSNATKKLVIKPFKVQPKIPENFGLDTWDKLKSALDAIYSKSSSFMSKEELYHAVEDACVHKLASKIYSLLVAECETNISRSVDSLLNQTCDHKIFLGLVDQIWKDHCEQINTIRNIFLYLDRSYALQNQGVLQIWDMGKDIFKKRLESHNDIQAKIISGLLYSVENYRQGVSYDIDVIGRITKMLITLELYSDRFEQPFLIDSRRFFTTEGTNLINSYDLPNFILLVDKRLQEASEMSVKYLDSTTKKPLFDIIDKCLLLPHVQQLIEKGFSQLIEEDRLDDLKKMFVLYERVQSLDLLKSSWGLYIK
eukprot:gene12401-16634_t